MTWSTGGTASTWPSWTAPVAKLGGTSSLVFRANPDSGMCFVNGTIRLSGSVSGTTLLSDSPAPAAFRPRSVFTLTAPGAVSVTLDAAGNLWFDQENSAAIYSGGTYRTWYFLDTPTP